MIALCLLFVFVELDIYLLRDELLIVFNLDLLLLLLLLPLSGSTINLLRLVGLLNINSFLFLFFLFFSLLKESNFILLLSL